MTAQFSDTVIFEERHYALAGVNGEGLFEPQAHGFTPAGSCSACWRGYVCTYGLRTNQLVLEGLCINNGLLEGRSYQASPPPAFGGCLTRPRDSLVKLFDLEYSDVNLPIVFSGGILIGTEFIRELYVHGGFHPAWKFRRVHELIFHDGMLTEHRDVSNAVCALRKSIESKDGMPTREDGKRILAWIEETLSMKYKL
jgi:hypothetical protein